MHKTIMQVAAVFCLGMFVAPDGPAVAQDRGSGEVRAADGVETGGTERLLDKLFKPFRDTSPIGSAVAQTRQLDDGANVSPSHVYQAGLDLISEIEILREAVGVSDYPGEAEPQDDRAPVHVYAKTLELMKKVAGFQRRLGMRPTQVGQIPVKKIVPKDVLGSVIAVTEQLRRVKKQLVIGDKIQPAPFEGAKTPSLVYKVLGDASFLMDGLVGRPITPTDVFANVIEIHDETELIAAKLKVALQLETPTVEGRKRPKDVAQQVLRATYKVINLQTRLGMDASGVPSITLVRVTPAEVYEATNILLAEMVRIKEHLNVRLPRSPRAAPRNKKPRHAFAQVLLLIQNLDILSKAAARAG